MRPNAQLFRKTGSRSPGTGSRALQAAQLPVATRRPAPTSAGLTPRIGRQRAATFSEACRAAENRCPAALSARLPRHGKHCCPCRRPPPGSPPRLAPSAGLVVVQASRWAMLIQRTKTMASKQPRKQTKSGAKVDTGEANKPARDRQRASRRRVSQARSGPVATRTSSAAVPAGVAPEGALESIELSKNTTRSPGDQVSQSELISEG